MPTNTPKPPKLPTPATFDRLRAAVLRQRVRLNDITRTMDLKYGPNLRVGWMSAKERAALTSAAKAYGVACDRFHAMLDACPRQWRSGAPTVWVCEELSYEDAVRPLGEPLTTTPPRAYGY